MTEDDAPETPAAPVNPHAEIERIASAAIGLPVRVTAEGMGFVHVRAPHHTTEDGKRAIVAAVSKARDDIVCFVYLDAPPAEP